MREFAVVPVMVVSLFVAYAQPAAAGDPGRGGNSAGAAPVATSIADSSDAQLLADRHLALYRASRAVRVSGGSARYAPHPGEDDGEAPAVVRTSATAALPLAPRVPANPSTEY